MSLRGWVLIALLLSLFFAIQLSQKQNEVSPRVVYGEPNVSTVPAVRPDIVLIVVDALRADHLGAGGYGKNTTPFIDGLSSRGVFFERAYSQESYTQASVPSILTSTYPWVHGVLYEAPQADALDDRFVTLPEVLSENGYATAAFVYNPHLKKQFNFGQGFDLYDDAPEGFVGSSDVERYETASKIRYKAVDWLKGGRRPFFMYLHFRDVHTPYLPPPPYDGLFTGGDSQEIDGYDGEIAYTDSQLRLLFADISRFSNDTVYVITADHGEEFGDHGGRKHKSSLYEELIHVPLIIYSPNWDMSANVKVPVESVDISPTILALAGIPAPGSFIGRSLIGLWVNESGGKTYIFSGGANGRLSIISGDMKYYVHMNLTRSENMMSAREIDAPQVEELYNLSEDPHERNNIIEKHPSLVGIFRGVAENITSNAGYNNSRTAALDGQTLRELKALGYLN